MKRTQLEAWKKILLKRQQEVGKVRDKLREDLDEMTMLSESCERAHDNIQCAIEALSELC